MTLPAPAAPAPAADQPAHVTLAIATLGSAEDADKITTALKGVKGVNDVTGLTMDSKRAVVTLHARAGVRAADRTGGR